jgi:hypothetical protein
MARSLPVSAIACFFLLTVFSCNSDNPASSQQACSELTVNSPSSGASLTVGSTVQIQWCFPSGWAYTQTLVDATISNSGVPAWKSVIVTPVQYPDNAFSWTIPADKTGDSCKIRVYDYDKNKFAYSGFFKIVK